MANLIFQMRESTTTGLSTVLATWYMDFMKVTTQILNFVLMRVALCLTKDLAVFLLVLARWAPIPMFEAILSLGEKFWLERLDLCSGTTMHERVAADGRPPERAQT